MPRTKNPKGLRTIATARDKESINEAAQNGFRPLMQRVVPSPELSSRYSIIQNKISGEIRVITDVRMGLGRGFPGDDDDDEKHLETVIPWTTYYPYSFESPYAAYLLPPDLAVGEHVYLEDLIEDHLGVEWQGNKSRRATSEAIWNGTAFEILPEPEENKRIFVG
jgi:hypothetical protein